MSIQSLLFGAFFKIVSTVLSLILLYVTSFVLLFEDQYNYFQLYSISTSVLLVDLVFMIYYLKFKKHYQLIPFFLINFILVVSYDFFYVNHVIPGVESNYIYIVDTISRAFNILYVIFLVYLLRDKTGIIKKYFSFLLVLIIIYEVLFKLEFYEVLFFVSVISILIESSLFIYLYLQAKYEVKNIVPEVIDDFTSNT